MEKRFDDILGLLKKSYGEILTPEEDKQFQQLMEDKRFRELYDELERGDLVREGIENCKLFSHYKGFTEFKRLRGRNKRRRLRLYVMLGTSAAVCVLAINFIFSFMSSWQNEHVSFATSTDIFPAGNEVRLLLGNGDTVSVSNEKKVLEDKGGAQIKFENGGLAYIAKEKSEEMVYNELLVPIGGECYLILEDSSKVWVNADSRLKYPTHFTGDERRIELEGEAYFEVKPGNKPFIVQTSMGDVKVLGTSFGVRVYKQEDMLTTLVSGRVLYRGRDSVQLVPGEQAVASLSGRIGKRVVDVDEYVGWKNGMYVFDHRPLEEIIRDLERWYGVTITFVHPELKRLPFTGYVKRHDKINIFLKLLESTGELKYKIEGKNILLFEK
ncbi:MULTISPECIES: FecR family protein [Butyricimonas]|uniref:FecR family protein n=1 Tax=Butyricimonas TaxID=574697 RepID=UPI0007FB463B|nr:MULTISPECIES: FecR domain-containing protein [Butyricimonas]